MSMSDFQMSYEYSPISLVGGIAQNMPGGPLGILTLLQSAQLQGVTSGGDNIDQNMLFAKFDVPSGGNLILNEIAHYPLGNQVIAANAQISQPLTISLVMKCPAIGDGGYTTKNATFASIKSTLDQHQMLGGTFNVATPAYLYTNCLLLDLTDTTGGEGMQVQEEWTWNFEMPLLTVAQAQQVQNNLMSQAGSGQQVVGTNGAVSWNGTQNTIGNPNSLALPSYVPSSSGVASSSVSGGYAQPGQIASNPE